MEILEEIWKDIEGYEGLYQVSNLGNVKSLKFGKEKILKASRTKKGYLEVKFSRNGTMKAFFCSPPCCKCIYPESFKFTASKS